MKSSVVRMLGCAAVLAMLAASTHHTAALAAQLEGATLADTLKAGEKTLKLNGLGLRKKAMFKVYVGGLYLESPSKDAGAILASDQAKAIRPDVKEGSTLTFTCLPGKGTTLQVADKELGAFEG